MGKKNKKGIKKALNVIRDLMDDVEGVVDDFEKKGRGQSAILGAKVVHGLLFRKYSELLHELDMGWEENSADDEWWNSDEWWEMQLDNVERRGNMSKSL